MPGDQTADTLRFEVPTTRVGLSSKRSERYVILALLGGIVIVAAYVAVRALLTSLSGGSSLSVGTTAAAVVLLAISVLAAAALATVLLSLARPTPTQIWVSRAGIEVSGETGLLSSYLWDSPDFLIVLTRTLKRTRPNRFSANLRSRGEAPVPLSDDAVNAILTAVQHRSALEVQTIVSHFGFERLIIRSRSPISVPSS